MSYMRYISFPKKLVATHKSNALDEISETGLYQFPHHDRSIYTYCRPQDACMDQNSHISFSEPFMGEVFKSTFDNPFIYDLFVGVLPDYLDQLHAIISSYPIDPIDEMSPAVKTMSPEAKALNDKCGEWMQQILHESLSYILADGEYAEMYTAELDGSEFEHVFPSPESEESITLRSLAHQQDVLAFKKWHKITIHKTV